MRRPTRLAPWLLTIGLVFPLASIRGAAGDDGTATWHYLDEGPAPPAGWRRAGFDDARWKAGPAPLGYGEPRVETRIGFGGDAAHKRTTAWFRREFDAPDLKPGERIVLLLCVDDGAVVYLDGAEVGRVNMPAGPVGAETPARRVVSDDDEGLYLRLKVPPGAVHPGRKSALAVEVHQASPSSSDLYFDLVLKVLPAGAPTPDVPEAARDVVDVYHRRHRVDPGLTIPDGYLDGGRQMTIDEGRDSRSGREILRVDRAHDATLARDLAFARSPEVRSLPPLGRIRRIAARIDEESTPPGGAKWLDATTGQLEAEFRDRSVLIGDWIDQGRAGVCRHRSLLFKILADEAGLKAALVRGNYASGGPPGAAHAWNEVQLDDGRRILVDVMLQGRDPRFLETSDPEVVRHYLKVDGTPWYGGKAH